MKKPPKKTVMVKDILDPGLEQIIEDLILVMSNRIYKHSEGALNIKLANPIAMQILTEYVQTLFVSLCERDGIEMEEVPTPDGVAISLVVRTRH